MWYHDLISRKLIPWKQHKGQDDRLGINIEHIEGRKFSSVIYVINGCYGDTSFQATVWYIDCKNKWHLHQFKERRI